MAVSDEKEYLLFEKIVEECRLKKANIVVVSLAGFGLSEFGRTYVARKEKVGVKLVDKEDSKLGDFNVVNFRFNEDDKALTRVDTLIKSNGADKKYCVLISQPSVLRTDAYSSSYLKSHVYSQHWIKTLGLADASEMIMRINRDLTKIEVEKFYQQSGGIASLIKALVVGGDEEVLRGLGESVLRSAVGCSEVELENLGLKKDGKLISTVLAKIGIKERVLIEVTADLQLIESGEISNKVTLVEKNIIEEMVRDTNYFISNEKISDIKWGEGKYDKYSDQAINKTMHRIESKMKRHKITTVWKTGYKLESK